MTDSDVSVIAPVRAGRTQLCLIDETGSATSGEQTGGFPIPGPEVLLDLYRHMVRARRFDAQVTTLTRQGRLAVYPSGLGQEATQIAATRALAPQDWLYPAHRDGLAMLTRGLPIGELLAFFRGDWHSGFDPKQYRVAPLTVPLATHTLHAVGLATAAKLAGDPVATLAFLGDGASSEGDAHEAMNFASTWQAPTVFVLENNQYAISVPLSLQTHARTLADRAVAYDMPGYYVDGNDAAVVYAVVSAALERARSGGGPTLIEAVTYRIEAHTNSDDPTRYRTADEVERWRARDPLTRLESYLRGTGALDDDAAAAIAAEGDELASSARELMSTEPVLDPLELFDHVYAEPRPALAEQRAALARELAAAKQLAEEQGAGE